MSCDGNSVSLEAEIAPGNTNGSPRGMVEYNGNLYFHATTTSLTSGWKVYEFDGTTAQTTSIPDGELDEGVVFNGELIFRLNSGISSDLELWSFDGTTATQLADIRPGSSGSTPSHLTEYNGKLYFRANDGTGNSLSLIHI